MSQNVVRNCWRVASTPTEELSETTDSEVYIQNLVVGLALNMCMWLMHQHKLEIICLDSDHQANGIDAVHQRSHANKTSMQL